MNTVPVPKVDVVKPKSALWVTWKNLPVALGFAANDPAWDFDCRECKANGYVIADAIKLEPVSTQTVSGLYFIHNDHLGTPKLLTNIKSFPGQYRDSETGYSYNYFRDYDPSLGQYVQSDPIGLQGGLNTYGYVDANPLRFFDPYGLSKFDKLFGLPKKFWQWYHRNEKRPGDADLDQETAEELFEEWKRQGKPGADTKKKWKDTNEKQIKNTPSNSSILSK